VSAGQGAGRPQAQGASRTFVVLWLAGIALVAIAVTGALLLYGRWHTPNYYFSLFGRSGLDAIALKSTLATVALALVAVQIVLALRIYQKLPAVHSSPRPVRLAHRVIGACLFALTIPIAIHCLVAYGVQFTNMRIAIHSVAGCFFYGAFAAKVLIVHNRRLPGWALPVAGGTLAVLLGVLWYTSALYYYNGFALPGL
jgi:hypothetical protein